MAITRSRWVDLLLLSAGLSGLLHAIHMPASVLLGCMLAGIWMGYRGYGLAMPKLGFTLAQSVVGCLIAGGLQLSVLQRLGSDWPFFLGVTVSILCASAALGWLLMRMRILPGSTAVWGLAPGAASAMVAMSEDFGADLRLVAFMQYLRVVMVTALASLVAHVGTQHAAAPPVQLPWLHMVNAHDVASTVAVLLASAAVARRWHVPGGSMLLPMLLCIGLQYAGLFTVELPPVLLGLAYAALGWSIGLRFNQASLHYAWKVLPVVTGAILALICVGLLHALLLYALVGFDALTAYLATSPGGADSVAVIAATSAVDAGFVMAMQMARFVMVLVFGPPLSRVVASRERKRLA